MVWQGVVLGGILEKVKPRQKLIRNLCKIDGLAKGHHFPTFANMVWQGVVSGTILGKVMPRRKPQREPLDNRWPCQGASVFQFFPTWSGKGWSWGAFCKK